MKLMDRFAAGLDQLGKKAAQAIDESKVRMDLTRVRRRRDAAARDLGNLTYRQSKGEILPDGDTEICIRRIAAADDEIAKLEAELDKVRTRYAAPPPEAPPPPAEPGPGPAA